MTSSTNYPQGRITILICLFLALWGLPAFSVAEEAPIRFGLTAVVVTENLRFLDQWSEYLESKMGREVELVMRRSYRDVMNLLDSGSIDFAWICGFPYVQKRDPESVRLLSVPIYRGQPRYHSYIIVPRDSPYRQFSDLKGKIFAFSDPERRKFCPPRTRSPEPTFGRRFSPSTTPKPCKPLLSIMPMAVRWIHTSGNISPASGRT